MQGQDAVITVLKDKLSLLTRGHDILREKYADAVSQNNDLIAGGQAMSDLLEGAQRETEKVKRVAEALEEMLDASERSIKFTQVEIRTQKELIAKLECENRALRAGSATPSTPSLPDRSKAELAPASVDVGAVDNLVDIRFEDAFAEADTAFQAPKAAAPAPSTPQ